ncbi:hypothetical protein MIMGU_mgv1a022124mg [Erythranthe guttata]|uniref:Uncharacterized protein n=1 Tax=Erythranthe guttata TaxID=4155 RepID=A0A022QRK5_ERYGU|nr:hypothetical protein MIMGU_mgv1a022124mg [Erythranthe guttata]
MASSHNKNCVLLLFIVILVLLQHFGHVSAYDRLRKIQPRDPLDQDSNKQNPPAEIIGFRLNRYKKIQTDAFRPTTPGNSPGMGHDTPPGRANKP